jgi:predicted outer membrane repeat protein
MASRILTGIGALAAVGFLGAPASAQTCGVPADHPTIQSAVDDASCATVSIAAGTYNENLYVWRSVTLNGAGASSTVLDGSYANSVVYVPAGTGPVAMNDLTIQHGSASTGGGISAWESTVLTLQRVAVRNNNGYFWGAGILSYYATITIADSTIADNYMPYNDGSGIRVYGGTATITGTTFSNNYTTGFGGAIAHSGYLHVTNSTFVGNTGGYGGAIGNDGTVVLDYVTMTGNNSTVYPGGGISSNGGSIQLHDTILAGNVSNASPSDYFNWVGYDPVGTGTNFSTTQSTAGFTVVSMAALNLQPLAANGGLTQTMLPGTGSVAIDAAPDCTVATDQRGVARPQGSACDVGAVEVVVTPSQMVSAIVATVSALPLSGGNADALLTKLNGAISDLAAGNVNGAKGKLGAFKNQVNAFVNSRRLTKAQADALTAMVDAVLAKL